MYMMKKLFITLIAILSCVSCCTKNDTDSAIISKSHVEWVGSFYKIKYDNHCYIVWTNGYRGGLTHDPDCDCHKQ